MNKIKQSDKGFTRMIHEAMQHLEELESQLNATHERLVLLESLPRCNGKLQRRKDKKYYVNHSTNTPCPLHGIPKTGGRLRTYIGKKRARINAARHAINDQAEYVKTKQLYAELLAEI